MMGKNLCEWQIIDVSCGGLLLFDLDLSGFCCLVDGEMMEKERKRIVSE